MFFRPRLEGLETRENPSGPGTVDPLLPPPTTPPADPTPPPPVDPAPTDPNHPNQ